jgi:hypothetical protein
MYRSAKKSVDILTVALATGFFAVSAPALTVGLPIPGAVAVSGLLFIGLSSAGAIPPCRCFPAR